MRKLMLVPILLALAVATNLAAMDQARGRWFGPGEATAYQNKDRLLGLLDRLNLADEQKTRIKVLNEAHLMGLKSLQEQMFRMRGDLKLLWLQSTPNKERIVAKQKEIRAIRDQIQDQSARYRLEVLNALTPEQQEKAKAFFVEGGAGYDLRSVRGPGAVIMGK